MPSAYDHIDPENPGVKFASEMGVDVGLLHEKIQDGLKGVSIDHFTDAELRVLQACVEVACGL